MTSSIAVLLLVFEAGIPVPQFVLPMPDAQACAMNMQVLDAMVTDKVMLACFDLTNQTVHVGRHGVGAMPKPEGDGEHE